ncbi:MAG: hypothetical protein MUC42_14150 [Bryobacter sp.]|nr:hypothetical protein [Bryobacter sp.]
MPKMIQLRNVPDRLHRQLKLRAKRKGLSLSQMLIQEAQRVVEEPDPEEYFANLRQRTPVYPKVSIVELIHQGRR